MKTNANGGAQSTKPQQQANNKRPENKDNLDSRENLEQTHKGDDVTHNKKETQNAPRKGKH